jgi:hypothetical protein
MYIKGAFLFLQPALVVLLEFSSIVSHCGVCRLALHGIQSSVVFGQCSKFLVILLFRIGNECSFCGVMTIICCFVHATVAGWLLIYLA